MYGAGSLLVDDKGTRLPETHEFPALYYATAKAQSDQLDVLRGEKELKWTFFSPAALFEPGEKTGKVQLGNDHFLLNDKHESFLPAFPFPIVPLYLTCYNIAITFLSNKFSLHNYYYVLFMTLNINAINCGR